jgi:transposase-like protein
MVDFSVRWDVVNAVWSARRHGHGQVTALVERLGVARSTVYRWVAQFEKWLEFGAQELLALRRELAELRREAERLRHLPPGPVRMSPREERRFIVQAAVLGTSDEEIATLLEQAGGRRLSHQTIHRIIVEESAVARVVFKRYFAGVGKLGAADEIFLGRSPLLLVVGPLSLLISGLRLAEGRGAKDWAEVFACMDELERCSSDGGRGLVRGAKDADVACQADLFHLEGPGVSFLSSLARSCEAKLRAEKKAERKLERARWRGGRGATRSASQRRAHARREAERSLVEYCRLDDLFGRLRAAFEYRTPTGRLAKAAEARALVAGLLAEMKKTTEGRRLAKKLQRMEDPSALSFLEVIEAGLQDLGLEQVGPYPEAKLARLVAETLAWRRRDKTPVEWLEQASTGSLADQVELWVIRVVDAAFRSSSYVECVNARIRLVQVARKRMSEDFLCLLAVHHNLKPFGRGSVREGRSPAALAGIALPTHEWLDLLELVSNELGQTAADAA